MRRSSLIFQAALGGLFALVSMAVAQPPDSLWSRTFGGSSGDVCRSVQETTDGGYILAGTTYSFGPGLPYDPNMWLVKTDANGNSMWSHAYGGFYQDECYSVIQASDGGYALAGYTCSFENMFGDLWLLKTNAAGDSLWSRSYRHGWIDGGNVCYAIQQTSDGGYALAGQTTSFTGYDMWLVRTDSFGDSLWTRTYGASSRNEVCYSMEPTTDGGFVLAGCTNTPGTGSPVDIWILKTDENGDSLWSRTFGGNGNDICYSVLQTEDGGFALAGYTDTFPNAAGNFFLIRTNSDGDSLWSRRFFGHSGEIDFGCRVVKQTADGGFVLAGTASYVGHGSNDFWMLRVDADGDSLWSCAFGGISSDRCYSMQQTTDGGYILAGTTTSFGAGGSDFWLVRTGPELGIGEREERTAVRRYTLNPVYPNPFNSSAGFSYDLPSNANVSLDVFDMLGRRVTLISEGLQMRGQHRAIIDGSAWASGTYIIRLQAGSTNLAQKAILLK